MNEANAGKSRALFVSFITRFSFIFTLQAIPPLFPMIVQEFKIGFTAASSLMLLVALPGLFISILGALLTGRYGIKKLLTIGLLICVLSSLLCFISETILFLQFSRFLLGVGGAIAVVAASILLYQWFEKGNLGMAMGFFGFCMPFGTVVAFNSLGIMALIHGWRASILITAVVNLIALVTTILLTEERKDIHPGKITFKTFRNVDIWILGLAWALFNMAMLGYSTWGKTVFTRYYGLSLEFSDLLAGMLMIGAFIQPLSGYISDIIGKRKILIIISQAAIFILILLFPKLPSTYYLALALLIGLIASFIIPNIFALSGELLGVKKGALGFGITNTFLNLGIILGPLSLGYVLDSTDSSYLFFVSMAIFVLLALIFSSIIRS